MAARWTLTSSILILLLALGSGIVWSEITKDDEELKRRDKIDRRNWNLSEYAKEPERCDWTHLPHGKMALKHQVKRRFTLSKIKYKAAGISCFNPEIGCLKLIIAGDINPNPRPKNCPVCERAIAKRHWAVKCDECTKSYHTKCGRVRPDEYTRIVSSSIQLLCCACCLPPLSDSLLTNSSLNSSQASSVVEKLDTLHDLNRYDNKLFYRQPEC